ncbi:hypothetical protein HHK36_026958 [Tetracentron sinense]|uniref:EF-hand domain-containing protein n=1 Tax=Tetracentron sinense TaxID=13715 RepID=A0A835D537_TETSI|nr:hypothetical protein HHK36_026958 [Tetracentron sinense]
MDEMREAALAYYEAGSEQLKQLAWKFFRLMDIDGDGRISILEFVGFLKQRGYGVNNNNNFFKELDRDRNGYLDFNEVLVFYYIVRAKRRSCNGCKALLKGLYFTCITCFDSCHESYDLCYSCYGHGRNPHHHSLFSDNYALLISKKGSSSAAPRAFTHKQQVWSFFSCMDMDGDGRVSKGEFMEFQRQRGYGVNSDNCFMELDTDHNGYLDFNEVLVFYYIVQVGRRSCNGCKALLKGLYFTCVGCFDSGYQSYDLCSTCYRQGRYHHHHHHHHHAVFLDNHAMLMSKKHLSSAGGSANTRNPSMVMHPPWPHTSTVHPPRKIKLGNGVGSNFKWLA